MKTKERTRVSRRVGMVLAFSAVLCLSGLNVFAVPDCVGIPSEGHCYNFAASEEYCVAHYYSKFGSYQCGWVNGTCDDVYECAVPASTSTTTTQTTTTTLGSTTTTESTTSTTGSTTTSTSTTTSSTTSTTLPEVCCSLRGDFPPCGEITLNEVVDLIVAWANQGQA